MANQLPASVVLSADKFQDFKQVAAQLSRYTHDFSAEIAGTAVKVWWQNTTTASVWNQTNGFQLQDESISSTDITPDEPVYRQYHLTPNEQASFGEEFLYKRIGPALNAVVTKVKTEAQNCLTSSTFPALTVSASAMTFAAVQSGSTVLLNSGSAGSFTLLASTNAYNALISEAKNANYTITANVSEGQPSFTYALMPHIKIIQEPSMPSGYSVMSTPDAVGIVLRQSPQLESYKRAIVLEPDTGVTPTVDLVEDGRNGLKLLRASIHLGTAVGKPGSAVRYIHP